MRQRQMTMKDWRGKIPAGRMLTLTQRHWHARAVAQALYRRIGCC